VRGVPGVKVIRRGTRAWVEQLRRVADNPDMFSRCRLKPWAVGLAVAISAISLWGAKEFVLPRPENASTYACKDSHANEKVTAALQLYNAPPQSDIFITPFAQDDILPVYLVITNDGDQPVALTGMRAQMVTASRSKLESLTTDDVFRRVAHISGSSTSPQRAGPIPLPGNTKNKKAQKQYQEIVAANFAAEAVEPHTTKAGFLFFDIQGVKQPAQGSHLYLTGIRDNSGNELMYFEIPVIPSNAASSGMQ